VTPPAAGAQRRWRAACPQCGAPVEFASAASLSAVCGYCSSALVREGAALQRIGQSAELFDDHSPLQRGASGRFQGLAFTLVGRLQIESAEGRWNEWHALFEGEGGATRSGWLSEDNGAYVLSFPAPPEAAASAPALDSLRIGQRTLLAGRAWDVAALVQATLRAAEGELPFKPKLAGTWQVAELRNSAGEVASLEDSEGGDGGAVHVSLGRSVQLEDLALSGLREADAVAEKTLGSRHFECPNCGAGLDVRLATSKSIACGSCGAVVDVAGKGAGDVLSYYQQAKQRVGTAEPALPLGSTAQLKLGNDTLRPWTVLGLLERCDLPEDSEDEQTFWREYLLYHQQAGFAFLVDAEDGWSWVRPTTGSPELRGSIVKWNGTQYQQKWRYRAQVTHVLGEFYWKVAEGETAEVTDFQGLTQPRLKLSRERTSSEVTWSAGQTLDAELLAQAFNVPRERLGSASADTSPLSSAASSLTSAWSGASAKTFWIFIAVVILLIALDSCSDDDCDDVRATFGQSSAEFRECHRSRSSGSGSRGGSYGGWSSGGGHK
jgi:ribosomal protein S27AE